MTKEDIIRMAREADIKFKTDVFRSDFCDGVYEDDFERFATLVASAERKRLATKFMEMHEAQKHNNNYWHFAARKILEEV